MSGIVASASTRRKSRMVPKIPHSHMRELRLLSFNIKVLIFSIKIPSTVFNIRNVQVNSIKLTKKNKAT